MQFYKWTQIGLSAAVGAILLSGCASRPIEPGPGLGSLWGQLVLAPPEGFQSPAPGPSQYGDPRLRDVRPVDHDYPGFAVVYLSDRAPVSDPLPIEIRSTRTGVRLSPESGVLGVAGTVAVTNHTTTSQIVSAPRLGHLEKLEPGGTLEILASQPGEMELHILGAAPQTALVFVSPGAFAICTEDGRWTLSDQTPGPARLHAWHHRYPPTMRAVDIVEGQVQEVQLRATVTPSENALLVAP